MGKFQRNNLPTFKGRYDLDGAQSWLREIERIFRVMDYSEAHKVQFGTHMLAEEANDWWINTHQVLDVAVEVVTWAVFSGEFLRKYFPEDVRGKKEIEFLELKHGNLSAIEYAARFVELAKFYPHYSEVTVEFLKCIKFKNGLRPEIKKAFRYQQIRRFQELVNNCRIYEDYSRARSAHYKRMSERRGKQNLNRGKPYSSPADKGKQRVVDDKRPSRGGAPTPLKFYRCGELGRRVSECKSDMKKCYKCGKSGHLVTDCKENVVTCYNYGEPGHISTHFPKSKQASTRGKVFALMGTQTSSDDRLIKGICYINNTPLIAIIDTSATHSFIVVDCVKRLGLIVTSMNGEMVIEIPAKGLVTTTSVCLNCPLLIFDKDFGIDLICLPLENLDVILGMNWLEFNHVYINCYNKSVRFLAPGEEEAVGLLSTKELKEILEKEAQVLVLFTVLSDKSKSVIAELQVMQEFLEVFPDDISDVSPEREVDFSIDLVPSTKPVSMSP